MPSHFMMGQETECLTVARDGRNQPVPIGIAVARLLEVLGTLEPQVRGPQGIFNAYGRVYLDGAHLELASAECVCPYHLALVVERQEQLVAHAARILMQSAGIRMDLSNVGFGGLLLPTSPVWGMHENHHIRVPPATLAARMVPFLATRGYLDAGAMCARTGHYLASARAMFLSRVLGGATTRDRALFSTARTETHLPAGSGQHRLHLILGDANQSHFSRALKFGTTALVAECLTQEPHRVVPFPLPENERDGPTAFWIQGLRLFNRLETAGGCPRFDPTAVAVQRSYHSMVASMVGKRGRFPAWAARVVADWDETLTALTALNTGWLRLRLDPWIKWDCLQRAAATRTAGEVPRTGAEQRASMALLNQQYHQITGEPTPFAALSETLRLRHRIPHLPPLPDEPHQIAGLAPRAVARSHWIRQHAADSGAEVDWMGIERSEVDH